MSRVEAADGAAPAAPRLLILTAVILAFVAGLNYYVNPFGLYASKAFPAIGLQSRSLKVRLLAAAPPPAIVVFGSSPSFPMSPSQITQATGRPAFNASVQGATPRDYHAFLRLMRARDLRPTVAIVALSFELLRPSVSVGFEPGDPLSSYAQAAGEVSATALAPLPLALDQTVASLRSLRALAATAPPAYVFSADGEGAFTFSKDLTLRERRGGNPELTFPAIDDRQWRHLAEFLALCRQHGTAVVVYFPPVHPALRQLWDETTSATAVMADLRQRLAAYAPSPIVAVHDFRDVDSFGGRADQFVDARHPDAEANHLMLTAMIGDVTRAVDAAARP